MPLSPEIIAEIDAYLASVITKRRIPELAPYTTYGELSLLDKYPHWMNAVDKTVWVDMLSLKSLLTTGGSGSVTPVLTGDTYIIEVQPAEVGTDTVLRSELDGKTYFLRLEGRPMKLGTEWELLTGGFKILNPGGPGNYELVEDQRFDAEIYELQSTTGGPAALSSSFVVGTLEVPTNTTLNGVNHANHLIQLRGGDTKITVTLPDIALTPEKAFLVIEACITNDWQSKIQTQGGQFIYMNNSSRSFVHIGIGEVLWLFKGEDGWYVINDFSNYYKNIGKPYAAYTYEPNENEIICKGQLVNREDYPRLTEKILTYGSSVVSEATWNTTEVYHKAGVFYTTPPAAPYTTVLRPYRGKWSTGDGSTTIRLPDLMNMSLRGILSESGSDPERYLNQPGIYQRHEFMSHSHRTEVGGSNDPDPVAALRKSDISDGFIDVGLVEASGGAETRMDNIGILWVTKF